MSEIKAIKFKNFTDRDFTWKFSGVDYTFKAGQEMYMEDFKALHFAKHLIDRELALVSPKTADWVSDKNKRAELEAKCLPQAEVVSAEQAIDIEAKKVEKNLAKSQVKEEKEFEDLEEGKDISNELLQEPKKRGRPAK